MAEVTLLDPSGRPYRDQQIQREEDFKREAEERLRQVRDEVSAFLSKNDSNRQLRLVLAYEYCMAWVENGKGESLARHFDIEQVLERVLEGQYVATLKET